MQIGFFDSGIGGLTVLHQAKRAMPQEDYLYYADTNFSSRIVTGVAVTKMRLVQWVSFTAGFTAGSIPKMGKL